jgi:hypothetical protein
MAKDAPPKDEMHYEAMAQDALRGVVKMALKRAASQGLPGGHNFCISYKTKAPGVSGPPELLAQYPDEMTIALQHQFWDLAPGETFFAVTLKFAGQPKRLSIPYSAVTRFYDPHVQFLLQFETPASPPEPVAEPQLADAALPAPSPSGGEAAEAPKIVSLDQFRKK